MGTNYNHNMLCIFKSILVCQILCQKTKQNTTMSYIGEVVKVLVYFSTFIKKTLEIVPRRNCEHAKVILLCVCCDWLATS